MPDQPAILYGREHALDSTEFRRVLLESGLGATRPIDDDTRLRAMLAGADLIVTARRREPGAPLIGVLRGISDGAWCCYVSEVAVSRAAQGLGIGRGLLEEARRQIGPAVTLMLASMPDAVGFYEKIGMARVPDVFWWRRER